MILTITHIVRAALIVDCMIWVMSEEVHIQAINGRDNKIMAALPWCVSINELVTDGDSKLIFIRAVNKILNGFAFTIFLQF